jgi:hypothetical protein
MKKKSSADEAEFRIEASLGLAYKGDFLFLGKKKEMQ